VLSLGNGGVGSTFHKYKEDQTNVWTPLIFYHFVMGFVSMHLLFLCLATPICSLSYHTFTCSVFYHTLLLCLVVSYYFILMCHLVFVPCCCCQTLKYLSRSFQKNKLSLGMANLKFSFPSLISFSCFILCFFEKVLTCEIFHFVCVCVYIYFHHIHYTFAFTSWCIKSSNFVNDCQCF